MEQETELIRSMLRIAEERDDAENSRKFWFEQYEKTKTINKKLQAEIGELRQLIPDTTDKKLEVMV